jgi:poly(A) polymerase
MHKLLAAPDPAPAVAAMAQAGVLARVLPGSDTRALAPLVHLEGDLPPRWQRRLAALGGQEVEERLRLSRADAAVLAALRDAVGRGWSPAALGWKLGAEGGRDAVLLRAALLESPLPTDWQTDVARGAASVMPVTAIDLMPDLQGAALGARLKEIEARWLASDLRLTRSDFLD